MLSWRKFEKIEPWTVLPPLFVITLTTPPTALPDRPPAMLLDLKLLYGFVGKVLQQAADDVVFVVAAINIDVDLTSIATVERDGTDARFRRIEVPDRPRLGRDDRQVRECSVQQWKVLDLTRRDRRVDLGLGRIDQRTRR